MKVNKNHIVFFFFLLFAGQVTAQQEPQTTQSLMNYSAYNPAYYGMSNGINIVGLARQQYVGFKDIEGENINPESFFLSADMPLEFLHGGLGLMIMKDKLGFMNNINLRLGYAYHTTIGYGNFSVGMNVGFNNTILDFSKLKPIDETDPVLEQRSGEEQDMMFNLSLGAYYSIENEYFVGISSVQLLEIESKNTRYIPRRHYFLTGGYYFNLNQEYQIMPSVMMQYDANALQVHLNSSVIYKEKYWGTIGYRLQDAITLSVGLYWRDFKVGYAYDIGTSKLAGAGSSGSHELVVNYLFKFGMDKNNKHYRTTRFL